MVFYEIYIKNILKNMNHLNNDFWVMRCQILGDKEEIFFLF